MLARQLIPLLFVSTLGLAAELPPMVPGTLEWDWVGNTYSDFLPGEQNGQGRWVQNSIEGMKVTPDGTVIASAVWDEGGRCLGLYKNGTVNRTCLGKNNRQGGHKGGGWGTTNWGADVVGDTIYVASLDHEFQRFVWKPGDINSATFLDAVGSGYDTRSDAVNKTKDVYVKAMSAQGDQMAILLRDGMVQIRAISDWAVRGEFMANGALDVCWGDPGMLWIAAGSEVNEYTAAGKATGRTAPDAGKPSAVAIAPDGRLVVCDDGPRQQVRTYGIKGGTVKLLNTFGDVGGISSGVAGVPTPTKLMRPSGANYDAAGNLYVATRYDLGVATSGCILRSFDPKGGLRWEQSCHVFSECWDVVPEGDRLVAYGFRSIFSKARKDPRGVWRQDAVTLDSINNPQDIRTSKPILHATSTMRKLDGVPYVFSWGSGGNSDVTVTQLDVKGKLGAVVANIGDHGMWAYDVDARGDLWHEADGGRSVVRRKHLSKATWGEPEKFALPLPINELQRLAYDAEHDVMYVTGYGPDAPKPNGEWGLIGRSLTRYEAFTSGKPTAAWSATMELDDGRMPPKAMAWAGDYVFTAACLPTRGLRAQIYVYSARTGAFVGRITAPTEIADNAGWVDLIHGLRVRVEQNGTYIITQEENFHGKMLVYIWKPGK